MCISLIGEILEARNFDGSNLFIQWQFKLPQYWEVDNSELVEYDPEEYEQVQLDEWNRLYIYLLFEEVHHTAVRMQNSKKRRRADELSGSFLLPVRPTALSISGP